MPDIQLRLGREVLVVDGGFGTMLQRAGVPPEQCPSQLNVTAPEIVSGIHRAYVMVGAECVTTNSFGGSRAKLAEYGLEDQVVALNRSAVRLARVSEAQHVLACVGPTGLVLEPLGPVGFDELFGIFTEQISALAAEAPDAILVETMTDIAEARCAVLAARSVCDLPVFATVTFGLTGVMDLSGTDPYAAAVVLEAAGAHAIGINCGLGPAQIAPLVEAMAAATSLPLIVQPNAGMPRLVDGVTEYPGTADEMGVFATRFVAAGASLVGSCCGSTPSFTGAIVDFAKGAPIKAGRSGFPGTVLAGPRGIALIGAGGPVAVIGERINPTGKRELAESLAGGSMSVVRAYAAEQEAAGAAALDVNVGAAGVDARLTLRAAVLALTASTDLPLVLDTTDAATLEAALRVYPGRALVNSVNGAEDSLASVLPLAARYGAAVVALALDDAGIPKTADGRVRVVERIRARALSLGMRDTDIVADTLVMTAGTDPDAPRVTVEALAAVHERGIATILGVSNVSHGLPDRSVLNAAFVSVAARAGLDAAIVDPSDTAVRDAIGMVDSERALGGRGGSLVDAWADWEYAIGRALKKATGGESAPYSQGVRADHPFRSPAERLAAAVALGDVDGAPPLVDDVISSGIPADRVIGEVLTPAIEALGEAFARGETFLPQLIVSAEAMKAAVGRVKTFLPAGGGVRAGRVVFATVKGDIHSIGKDICVSLLESHGFAVNDLGVDVPVERVLEAARDADVVCLSALMTTTLGAMEATVRALATASADVRVLVGGAVVTEAWAATIGAGYSDDAPGCVREVAAALDSKSPR